MPTSNPPKASAKKTLTTILLKSFPVALHRGMKAEAARRGLHVRTVYAEACERYLARVEGRGRKTPS